MALVFVQRPLAFPAFVETFVRPVAYNVVSFLALRHRLYKHLIVTAALQVVLHLLRLALALGRLKAVAVRLVRPVRPLRRALV